MAVAAKAPAPRAPIASRRGVSLGLVGLLFMFLTPVGLIVAWWHPLFRQGKKRDRALVFAVYVYLAMFVGLVLLDLIGE